MRENSKSIPRRLHDPKFIRNYFVGEGIDIGGKPDPLALYVELFPLCRSVRNWDWEDGDAQFMAAVANDVYDFVFASHCLEHLLDPAEGLRNWIRIVRPGGHLIVTVPDEDLYEQGVFPDGFNRDHKWTFTISKNKSWSQKCISLIHFLPQFCDAVEIVKLERIDYDYRHRIPRYDRTITPVGESGIELILRKRDSSPATYVPCLDQPTAFDRRYLNQYKTDRNAVIAHNGDGEPFKDERDV